MPRKPNQYTITKSSHITMTYTQYAKSGLYLDKKISHRRVAQLVGDKVLRRWRKNPNMVFGDKVRLK